MQKKTSQSVKANGKGKNEKRKIIMGIAMMIFAVAISVGTYAYYQTTITGSINATILTWDCANTGSTGSGTVNLGNLQPGSSGSFTFLIKSTNFRTDVDVKMSYASTANVPGNFKLYKTKSGTTYSNEISLTTVPATIFTNSNVAANTPSEYYVYYNWPYGTTAEDELSSTTNLTFTINYTVTCTQSSTYNS